MATALSAIGNTQLSALTGRRVKMPYNLAMISQIPAARAAEATRLENKYKTDALNLDKTQFNTSLDQSQKQFDTSLAQTVKQFNADQAQKKTIADTQADQAGKAGILQGVGTGVSLASLTKDLWLPSVKDLLKSSGTDAAAIAAANAEIAANATLPDAASILAEDAAAITAAKKLIPSSGSATTAAPSVSATAEPGALSPAEAPADWNLAGAGSTIASTVGDAATKAALDAGYTQTASNVLGKGASGLTTAAGAVAGNILGDIAGDKGILPGMTGEMGGMAGAALVGGPTGAVIAMAPRAAEAATKIGEDVVQQVRDDLAPAISNWASDLWENTGGQIFCFIAGTPITMDDNTTRPVEILNLGDETYVGGAVYGIGKAFASDIYNYKGIQVEGHHAVFESGRWIRIKDSDKSHPVNMPNPPDPVVVYPIATKNHLLVVNGIIFADLCETDQGTSVSDTERLTWLNSQTSRNQVLKEIENDLKAFR